MQKVQAGFFTRTVKSRLRTQFIKQLILIVYLIVIGVGSVTFGQSRNTQHTLKLDDQTSRPAATIDSIAWLVGSWSGSAFGGTFEEVWLAASSGTMVGTFKLMHNNKPTMYELMLIVEEKGSLNVKLKHFNADFTAWEEKDKFISFPLVKLTVDAAYFNGLTYRRDGSDRLKVYVAIKEGEDVHEEELLFHRMRSE